MVRLQKHRPSNLSIPDDKPIVRLFVFPPLSFIYLPLFSALISIERINTFTECVIIYQFYYYVDEGDEYDWNAPETLNKPDTPQTSKFKIRAFSNCYRHVATMQFLCGFFVSHSCMQPNYGLQSGTNRLQAGPFPCVCMWLDAV